MPEKMELSQWGHWNFLSLQLLESTQAKFCLYQWYFKTE